MTKNQGLIQRLAACMFQRLLNGLVGQSPEKTHLEVERKFRVTTEERLALPSWLRARGFEPAGSVKMTDIFLPARAEGDMARLRQEREGGAVRDLLTLKTWVATADGGKERKEMEGQIGSLARSVLLFLGRRLNGQDLPSFSKHRDHFRGRLDDCEVTVSIDEVEGLGAYSGLYLEVEVLVPVGADVDPYRRRILSLVAELLGAERQPVKLSYMEMLKSSRQRPLS